MSAPSIRTNRLRSLLIAAVLAASLLPTTSAFASHTPNPTSVTVAGSLQSERGLRRVTGIRAARRPTWPTTPTTTSGRAPSTTCPPASYEYKAALNDAWDENYGLHAVQRNGANIPLNLPASRSVKFYYDHKSHWVTDNHGSVIAVAPGQLPVRAGLPR